jgi:hypothetical protein
VIREPAASADEAPAVVQFCDLAAGGICGMDERPRDDSYADVALRRLLIVRKGHLVQANRFDPSNPDLAKVGTPKSRGTIKHQRLGGRQSIFRS